MGEEIERLRLRIAAFKADVKRLLVLIDADKSKMTRLRSYRSMTPGMRDDYKAAERRLAANEQLLKEMLE